MSKTPLISIVDDDDSVREGTMNLIRAMGFIAEAYSHAGDFLNSKRIDYTSCLIADVRMPGMTGLELHDRLVGGGKIIPTILVTAFPDERDRARALQAGVICYLSKPYTEDELLGCLRAAFAHHKMLEGSP